MGVREVVYSTLGQKRRGLPPVVRPNGLGKPIDIPLYIYLLVKRLWFNLEEKSLFFDSIHFDHHPPIS